LCPGGAPPGRTSAPGLLSVSRLSIAIVITASVGIGALEKLRTDVSSNAWDQAAVQTPSRPDPQPPSTNASPSAPSATDPATVTFASDVGLLLVPVKPDKVADYEAAIVALQDAFARSTDSETRKLASGWRVFKAVDTDAKSPTLFVHLLQPTVPGTDYRPSLWLDKLLAGAPADLLAKYRDAFAGPPSKLGLTEFANMAVAPVSRNVSPAAPTTPPVPRNAPAAEPVRPPRPIADSRRRN